MILLRIISHFIFLIKSLDFLYLFQTKEYRLDRIINFLKEENSFRLLYLRTPRLPAKSPRNILISIWILLNFLVLVYTTFTLDFENQLLSAVLPLVFAPVSALLYTLIGILLTEPIVLLYRKYLINKARQKIKNSKAIFIGITGSYGKTSTKEFLYQILSQKFKVTKTDKNHNSEVGIAVSILKNLKPDTQYFIAELGAYKKGEIKDACGLIHPKYGILTGIGNQHLSLFGSKKNLLEAKAELFETLPKEGIAYINMNIKERNFFGDKTKAKKVFYSVENPLFDIKTNLIGKHNLQNLLPCVALAIHLGVDKKEIDRILMNLKPVEARLSLTIGINGSTTLNDSYNSNIQGFLSAIQTANELKKFSKKLILSRGLIELGEEKTQSYQTVIDELNKSDLTLLTTDKLFKDLDKKNRVLFFKNETLLLDYIKENTEKNTLLVMEGRFEPRTLETLMSFP